ncbi:ABC transporter permease [Alloacidobacterium sp.]|uniref:ABC transporter permease n=1 Tax=Alloacidobacterium sp. TaxID=2951999 RepID=UPI002D55C38C|nr:ABC transporter permease [Alloacidobacterium sp.]HYK34487.1 ABC transporter permease [Alloacidobacterium sp.]
MPDWKQEISKAERRYNHSAPATATSGWGNVLADLLRDLNYGLRSMARAPAFSFFAILALALGIGASTTVFTVVNTLLLHPLPAQDPSRLVSLYTTDLKNQKQSASLLPISYLNLKDYQARTGVFSSLGGFSPPMPMTLVEGTAQERFFGQLVTQGYFEALGLIPAKGRFFLPSEVSTPGSAPVAVLSYGAWKNRFNSGGDVIGKTLEINGVPFTVVGVAPQGFLGVSAVFGPDLWLPATMAQQVLPPELQDVLRQRGKPFFQGIARLGSGISRKQADASLEALAAALRREYPDANAGHATSVQPVTTALFSSAGGEGGLVLVSTVLLLIVGLVLLIACSNVANLLMARAVSRRQEIAVRLAIGASRRRLFRQLLTESVLLGLFGGIAGLGVGYEGCRFLWSFRPPQYARNLADPKLDGTVFLFAFLLSLATGFIFGVVPALRTSKTGLVECLKEETHVAGPSGHSARFQKTLLAGQVAFSLVSLIAASLFLRAVQRAYDIDPGFDHQHLAVLMMNPEQQDHDVVRHKAFHRQVEDRVSRIPGIQAVTWASNMPFWSSTSRGIFIEGQDQQRKSETISTVINTIDVDYLKTMQIPLLQGRAFTAGDQEGSLPVVIINEDLARRYWPHGNAIGNHLRLSGDTVTRQIVGVVKTSNYTTLGEPPQPCLYLPFRQSPEGSANLYVRSAGDPSLLLTEVQRAIKEVDPSVQVTDVRTGAQFVNQVLWNARIVLGMLGIFGLLALALASVGLYGILAYSVRSRQREIGVRMALGASRLDVLRLVLRQGMMLVAIGVSVGLAISLLIGRAFSRMLFGLSPADPLSLLGASVVLLLVAAFACYLPALAASRMDPMQALRDG